MDPPGSTSLYDMKVTGTLVVASVYVGSTYEIRTAPLVPTTPPSEGTVLHQFANSGERKEETLLTDGTNVYWSTNSSPYTVYRKPLNNPSANIQNMFTAPTGGYIYQLIDTPTAFYYYGWISGTGYGMFTASKTPGTSAQALTGLQGLYSSSSIGGFVAAGNRLFWAGYNQAQSRGEYYTGLQAGGAPQSNDLTISNSYTYIGAVSDGTHVYWTTYAANGSVRRAAIATPATVQDVALSVSYPDKGLAVDATYVYFTDNSNNVWRSRKDGSTAKERIAQQSGSQFMNSIAGADANYLYGPGYTTGTIVRISKTP
jgi:hypothetical protein